MGKPVHLILPLALIAAIVWIGYTVLGPIPAVVFTVAFGGGLILYMATAWRTPFDAQKVIVPYLLTVLLFLVHTYEEYVTDFREVVSVLAGHPILESHLLFFIAWLAPFLWVSGAIMLIKQWAFGYYFLCAFFVAMTIAELAHFVFPFVIYGEFRYVSGMYTAALPLMPAYYGLYVTVQEMRRIRAAKGGRSA